MASASSHGKKLLRSTCHCERRSLWKNPSCPISGARTRIYVRCLGPIKKSTKPLLYSSGRLVNSFFDQKSSGQAFLKCWDTVAAVAHSITPYLSNFDNNKMSLFLPKDSPFKAPKLSTESRQKPVLSQSDLSYLSVLKLIFFPSKFHDYLTWNLSHLLSV